MPPTFWQQLLARERAGDTNRLLKQRRRLFDAISAGSFDNRADEVRARALSAKLSLIMLDKKAAQDSLGEFATDPAALAALETSPDLLGAARLHTEIANLHYRCQRFRDGEPVAQKADELLQRAPDSIERRICWAENQVWLWRLRWQGSSDILRLEVDRALQEVARTLTESYYAPEHQLWAGAIDLTLALALDLWAGLDWARARSEETARRKIYQALFLLHNTRPRDQIRSAFSLLTAARIEAATPELASAAALARASQAIFAHEEHPFQGRALNQWARCLVKANRPSDAKDILQQLNRLTITDQAEQEFAIGEALLTKIWLLEHQADEHRVSWEDCLKLSADLANRGPRLPKRLQAEGFLHYGLALLRLDRFSTAQQQLLQGLQLARPNAREKIAAGCHLALAECFQKMSALSEAHQHWTSASHIIAEARSTFLSAWRDKLAPFIEAPVPLDINAQHDTAEALFWKAYLSYHIARSASRKEALARTGLTGPTFSRLCRKYDVHPNWHEKRSRQKVLLHP